MMGQDRTRLAISSGPRPERRTIRTRAPTTTRTTGRTTTSPHRSTPLKARPNPPWSKHQDEQGYYWYNAETHDATYDDPHRAMG